MSSTRDSSHIAESISSTNPFLRNTEATMSDTNGKAPVMGASNGTSHTGEQVIKVQPPRREDLQPSYARVIQPDDADADTNGWYGGMVSYYDATPIVSIT